MPVGRACRSLTASALGLAAVVALGFAPRADATPARGYELVTPRNKPQEVYSTAGYDVGVTTDGEHLFFGSTNIVDGSATMTPHVFRSDRGASGWATRRVTPDVSSLADASVIAGFGDNLDAIVKTGVNFVASDTDNGVFSDPDYYRFSADRTPALLSPNVATPGPAAEGKLLQAVTSDASGVVFYDGFGDPLLPGESPNAVNRKRLYEDRDGTLRRIDVDDAGVELASSGGSDADLGNLVLGGGSALHAYSDDGSRIYFEVWDSGQPGDRPGLYLRADGNTTRPIPALPAGANASSRFLGATPDGRHAYFATTLPLTADDIDSSSDLYDYDAETGDVRRLSGGASPADVPETSTAWASDDGSRVYFVANGQLIAGKGSATGPNTYLWDHGTLRLVAGADLLGPTDAFTGGPQCEPTRMTPDGRYLLTQTTAALTPDDTDGGSADLYRYDAGTGSFARVSAGDGQDGGPYDATLTSQFFNPACDWQMLHASRAMSDDGRYVFFETKERLAKGDANAQTDVYVWDAHDGKASLVTTGRSDEASDFLDATPDGTSVFFTTSERLSSQDTDGQIDIYDARIGGGFPEPGKATECRESECQGALAPEPAIAQPSSATLNAPVPVAPQRRTSAIRPGLVVRRLGGAALRRLWKTGRATVHVHAAKAGTVMLTVRVRGRHGWTGAARVARRATGATWTSVPFRLDRAERRLLRRHRRLLIRVHEVGATDVVNHYAVAKPKGTR